jgi:tRNA (cytidine/uridine-2'-O-)-methyltransferase
MARERTEAAGAVWHAEIAATRRHRDDVYDPVMHIVLYEPEIPHNAGAAGRTCVAVGAKLWLVRPIGFRIDDRQLRRAGLDYWQHLDWEVVENWEAMVRRLPDPRPWFFSKRAEIPYTDVRFKRGDVLVFGSESQGLPRSILDANRDRLLKIPIRPEARSLNLSVSVGIAAFEARRQMREKGLR